MEVRDYLIDFNALHNSVEKEREVRETIRKADFDANGISFNIKIESCAESQKQIAEKYSHRIITCLDDDYPKALRELYDFPFVLYCWGNIARLRDVNKIAIIGTRKPTYDARKICDSSAKLLANYNYTIVSGLALGTDSLAHRGALTYGAPTIAVLASAVNEITPRTNSKLAKQILLNDGLLISETAYGNSLQAFMYVKRNRIVSGLCEKVFIVEAGRKSGSMTTAGHAADQNKNIYAMPGSISNPVAYGTNRLIQNGAFPVLEAEDLFGDITDMEQVEDKHPILERLRENGVLAIEELAYLIDLPVNLLLPELTLLEFSGKIAIENNKIYLS